MNLLKHGSKGQMLIILPLGYGLLCHGFNKYWFKNDLR